MGAPSLEEAISQSSIRDGNVRGSGSPVTPSRQTSGSRPSIAGASRRTVRGTGPVIVTAVVWGHPPQGSGSTSLNCARHLGIPLSAKRVDHYAWMAPLRPLRVDGPVAPRLENEGVAS
jgi:hypothetical protein